MKIGIIGWYGHENAGDERLLLTLRRFYKGNEFLIASGLDDASRKIDDINCCDYVLLGGGGLILRGFGRYAEFIEKLRPKFGCVGISVEAVHRDNEAFIDAIKTKADFIYVRDVNSQTLLECHPKVVVGPDLSYLYPFKLVEPKREECCGLNLRHWHYAKAEYGGRLYRSLVSLDKRFSNFKRIYPFTKWEPGRLVTNLRNRFDTVFPLPLYTEGYRKNDIKELQHFFRNVPLSFSPHLFNEIRYLVGMRLHSLIFASQMGIPFLSLSYQPKNVEFCKSIQMDCSIDLFNMSGLHERLEYLKEHYDEIRAHLIEFSNQQKKLAWETMNLLSQNFPLGRNLF